MIAPMLTLPAPLTQPGLFVTGTDTGVGKTVVSCAILHALRQHARGRRLRLGVCKPFATGAHDGRDGPEQEDVHALMHFAECHAPVAHVCPQAFRMPAAPAAAAAAEGRSIDWPAVADALVALDQRHDALLIEGVGGIRVPLDPAQPRCTVVELIVALGYPVLVVCRAGLGTLNHTAMTVEVLERAGARVVGLVMNHERGRDPDELAEDASLSSNRVWLERMTGIKVLCEVPGARPSAMAPGHGRIDPAVLDAVAAQSWGDLFEPPRPR